VEKIKGAEDLYREAREKELEVVRQGLRKAAEIRDPKQMWNAVQEVQNLLTMILYPEADVVAIRPYGAPVSPQVSEFEGSP